VKVSQVSLEIPQPGAAERAVDTAADMSRTIAEMTAALQLALTRLRDAVADVRQPGRPVARLRPSPARRRCFPAWDRNIAASMRALSFVETLF
jgi:hypothetical protein